MEDQRLGTVGASGQTRYLKRFLAGRVPTGDTPDLPTLRFIRDTATQGLCPGQFEQEYLASLEKITGPLNKVVQFASVLRPEIALSICDTIMAWVAVPEHAEVWQRPGDYVYEMMRDVFFILTRSSDQAMIIEWARDRILQYGGCRPLVIGELLTDLTRQDGSAPFLLTTADAAELWGMLAEVMRAAFVMGSTPILPALGHGASLHRFVGFLQEHADYESLRPELTRKLIDQADHEEEPEMRKRMILSLVSARYPAVAGEPPPESYTFSVDTAKNEGKYDMALLVPALERWGKQGFADKVAEGAFAEVSRAYRLGGDA